MHVAKLVSSQQVRHRRCEAVSPTPVCDCMAGFMDQKPAALSLSQRSQTPRTPDSPPPVQYMRHHNEPHYTPEPDVVHELIGGVRCLGGSAAYRRCRPIVLGQP